MKILVTGAGPNGFLGYHVREAFSDLYCTFIGSSDCNLTDYMHGIGDDCQGGSMIYSAIRRQPY